MNYYRMSNGDRISKKEIDARVRKAKEIVLRNQIDELGYNVCCVCGRNDCKPIDCSHNKSVDWCQKNGCAELSWDITNIEPTGRNCHKKKDGLDLQFSTTDQVSSE